MNGCFHPFAIDEGEDRRINLKVRGRMLFFGDELVESIRPDIPSIPMLDSVKAVDNRSIVFLYLLHNFPTPAPISQTFFVRHVPHLTSVENISDP